MKREPLPKKTKDSVLDEYNHRCAICGKDRPHIHHIDEDPENNISLNLLPLCPNCHPQDQHNPTRRVDIAKLTIFRRYKDPAILRPQFHPIFTRQRFLDDIEINDESIDQMVKDAEELTDFVSELEMGSFYAKRIKVLLGQVNTFAFFGDGPGTTDIDAQIKKEYKQHREKVKNNAEAVRELLVEMLRYQAWANAA